MKNNNAKISCENGYLKVSGELNFATVMDIWNESQPFLANEPELKFDFANVTQANSAVLALLLEWLKYAKQYRKSISFNQLPEKLKSIAKVAGMDFLLVSK